MLRSVSIWCACLLACSTSADDTGSGDGSAVGDLLGTFKVELVEPATDTAGYTSIVGKVYDGTQPETVIWTEAATSGDCVLLTPSVPFCSPACGSTGACVGTNTCQAYPTSQNVGTVSVSGVKTSTGSTSVALTAVANSYQPPAGITLAYPAFDEGSTVSLSAGGATFADAFSINAKGIAPLELTTSSFALASGQALTVAWTPAATASASTVAIKLDISHHGGSKGKLECTTSDAGSLTIAASLVDQLLALGAAGYPTIIVTRSAVGHAAVASGHVDLLVASELERPIDVPGVTSCTSDDDCVAPATCQDDLTCQ